MVIHGTVAIVAIAVAISILSFPACVAAVSDSVTLRGGNDGRIIPVPSAPQLRYQSTDFVGKSASTTMTSHMDRNRVARWLLR
jgi:hypothetical protein